MCIWVCVCVCVCGVIGWGCAGEHFGVGTGLPNVVVGGDWHFLWWDGFLYHSCEFQFLPWFGLVEPI